MHIHPSAIGLHPINSYAAGNERAASAETRKRLLKAAQSAAAAATPEEDLLIGQCRHSQVLPGDSYRAASEGEDPDFA